MSMLLTKKRPSQGELAVAALERWGHVDLADRMRAVVGMPPRELGADERFLRDMKTLCVEGPPVGFPCADEDEARHRCDLAVRAGYHARMKGSRIEVFL